MSKNKKVPSSITPLDWFESWLLQRSNERENPLTPEAAEPYRYIWSSWCQWLLGKPGPAGQAEEEQSSWTNLVLQASPNDAMEFLLDRVKPATQRSGSAREISIVTRERYCMVLRGVYGHLLQLGLLIENPMKRLYELAGEDRPDAEVLPDPVWNHLEHMARQADDRSPFALRDRALIWLMLDVALTPAELSALNLGQLDEAPAIAIAGEGGSVGQIAIRLQGNRAAQRRDLQLNELASDALRDWLAVRTDTLEKGQPEALVVSELVFFTERRKPLSRRVLFHLTSKLITAACQELGQELPRHLGPLVLRNTAILHWLKAGMPQDEVLRRAGYQGRIALEHLRAHLPRENSTTQPIA
ncbi:tyrosine-type recombinase/integrase [Malikia sp.]|uniref:tyrosine-type recombinase/integrase n=1 Tax=Malikia sp. TaxID=2070706 RepID=UPI00261B39C1|nr:tyrosine-type recombinase/integrase [Malikia sp.]MDD2728528.1 tyrosine-type recombinase/integrase [Malikia sp.]